MDIDTKKGIKDRIEHLIDKGTDLAESYIELSTIKVNKKIASAGSNTLFLAIVIVLLSFIMLFLGIALAFWIASYFDSNSLGFLLTAGIFLLLIIFMVLFKKSLLLFVKNTIIKKMYDDED